MEHEHWLGLQNLVLAMWRSGEPQKGENARLAAAAERVYADEEVRCGARGRGAEGNRARRSRLIPTRQRHVSREV